MGKRILLNLLCVLFMGIVPLISHALIESKPLSVDKRLRVIVYNPNDIFKYTGFYGYESSIVFSSEETIDTITMGDSLAWQLVPNGNRLFIKPVENEATTNMTIITNKRVYHFELHAGTAKNINDPNLVFSLKFLYPDDDGSTSAVQQYSDSSDSDINLDGKGNNFNYTVSGKDSIVPIKIFDDGYRTFLEFNTYDQDLPSFYIVYPDGTEGIVNYSVSGKYIVIERVGARFTLRSGNDVGCIFNENLIEKEAKLKNSPLSNNK